MQGGSPSGGPNFWGQLVLKLRIEHKMSQRELADRAKINRTTLRRIEEGQSVGDIDSIERLLGVLGHELDALSVSTGKQVTIEQVSVVATLQAEKSPEIELIQAPVAPAAFGKTAVYQAESSPIARLLMMTPHLPVMTDCCS